MIVELIVSLLVSLVTFLAGLFGTLEVPSWWTGMEAKIEQLAGFAAGFGQWVPIDTLVAAVTFLVGCLALSLVIKVVRVVASFFTAGGGSAA